MPNVLALIGALYEGPDMLRALSAYGMVMGLAAVGGQLLGGALLAADPAGLEWRTCFLINVPIGARRAGAGAVDGARITFGDRRTDRRRRHRRW